MYPLETDPICVPPGSLLLLDRLLRKAGKDPTEVSAITRLCIVGDSGPGGLRYCPAESIQGEILEAGLDRIAEACEKILNSEEEELLDSVFQMAGSSGGARPKINLQIDGERWLVKFPAPQDDREIGRMEYEYAQCAKDCGIHVAEHRLLPSEICGGYFASKRFDRIPLRDGTEKRIHMLSAAALLELDPFAASMDYRDLMKLTKILTGSQKTQLQEMFRRMCFNVFAHNRDDHAKNFSYLYDELQGSWKLSPAYDLTYSTTYYGEHTTSVDGCGADPGENELMNVGAGAGLAKKWCAEQIRLIGETVEKNLSKWIKA